jgi:CheY-like chemotaxis protein
MAVTANALKRDRERHVASNMNGDVSKPTPLETRKSNMKRWLPDHGRDTLLTEGHKRGHGLRPRNI